MADNETCKRCQEKIISDGGNVICGNCSGEFHIACSGLSERTWRAKSQAKKAEWHCSYCRDRIRSNSVNSAEGEGLPEELRLGFSRMTETLERLIQAKMEKFEQIFGKWETKIEKLTESMGLIENELKLVKSDLIQQEKVQLEMKNNIEQLKIENEELKYAANANKIEITGLCVNEISYEEQVRKLLKVLHVEDIETNVKSINKINRNTDSKIIVEIRDSNVKQKILKQSKIIRPKLSLFDNTLPDKSIYINHCMTPYFKKIYYEAKQMKLLKNYKFLWVTEAGIFIKKTENGKTIKLNSLSKLDEIK
jgi:hypothetical protein